MKVLLFGTGDYYNRYKKWFASQKVPALLDNSGKKQNTMIDGLEVLSPEEGIKLEYDAIVILSFYVTEMKRQLVSLGVEEQKIYHFYDLHRLFGGDRIIRPMQYYLNAEELVMSADRMSKVILLISHDMTLGGPAIALFHAAEVLKKNGYEVLYASMSDGPLRELLTESDIPCVVDENLQIATMNEIQWVNSCSLMICNTLNFHVFLSERDTSVPVIWWLHDAPFFYEGVDRDVIGKVSLENLRAVTVGKIPEDAVKEFLPQLTCGRLLYGVADAVRNRKNRKNHVPCRAAKVIRFITIGFIEERKGQDLLMQAIKRLPKETVDRCEFFITGHDATLLGEKIKNESISIGAVHVTGSVNREKIHELLENSDVLVCPSRQDPMPTVVSEAMMHAIPCIVSDATGTAAYIHKGEDGLVFKTEDGQDLMEKIIWCVGNQDKLKRMGQSARKLYERYFSMKAFEDSFMETVSEALEREQRRGQAVVRI